MVTPTPAWCGLCLFEPELSSGVGIQKPGPGQLQGFQVLDTSQQTSHGSCPPEPIESQHLKNLDVKLNQRRPPGGHCRYNTDEKDQRKSSKFLIPGDKFSTQKWQLKKKKIAVIDTIKKHHFPLIFLGLWFWPWVFYIKQNTFLFLKLCSFEGRAEKWCLEEFPLWRGAVVNESD